MTLHSICLSGGNFCVTDVFGHMPDGRLVERVTLASDDLSVSIITYGASLQKVEIGGQNVILSGDTLEDYVEHLMYFGAIVGRVANRIGQGRANVAGREINLDKNEESGNCLHGGPDGSSQMVWTLQDHSATYAILTLHMPDGHMGFSGALDVTARYSLEGATLRLEISAESDQETLCAFASHGYWTLSDEANINAHEMRIAAQQYLPIDANKVPTGEQRNVAGTQFDFRQIREIGTAQMDHNFCIRPERGALEPVLWLKSKASGIALEVASTEAGVQIYDATHLGRVGLAIEPQVWPDAVNHEGFPSMVLKAGETCKSVTEFRFSKSAHS